MSAPSHNPKALGAKDANVTMATTVPAMQDDKMEGIEYHRQVVKSKLEAQQSSNNYVSPSDHIMSPCTAKLTALRNKQVGKVKPKSLFAHTSSKRLQEQDGIFGVKAIPPASVSPPRE
ncbi:hypothetical protein BD289DRAFT_478861 [Coniella lustricola]|uniref:Spo12 family-domain-containing protein n=1 Tax=Coniella lustricola TaxID=2025994 RepID=A0A2T3ALB4_9PEZI|nr:hypothetical protein BD289DRAFT_478861 [Coniella lustricola]